MAETRADETGPEQRARVYHRLERRVAYAEFVLGLAFLVMLLVSGLSFRLRDLAAGLGAGAWVSVPIYFVALALFFELLTLPLSIYGGLILERRFGLLNQSVRAWAWDLMKSLLVSLGLGLFAVELLYGTMRLTGAGWWLVCGAVFALWFVLLAQLTPVAILPLFYTFTRLRDEDLATGLVDLCRRAGTRISGVYEWKLSTKTRRANAGLMGWGATRRVVLADTLLKNFPAAEVEVVLAHELGHQRLRHLPILMGVQVVLTFAAFFAVDRLYQALGPYFGLTALADPAGMPLVALICALVGLMALPWINLLSRRLETAADRFALELTGKGEAFLSAMERLGDLNLAEKEVSPVVEFLFHSHPALARRTKTARAFIQKGQG